MKNQYIQGLFKMNIQHRKNKLLRVLVSFILCVGMLVGFLPQNAQAYVMWHVEMSWSEEGITNLEGDWGVTGEGNNPFTYLIPASVRELIDACQKYSDRKTTTGIRNQIDWMKQLYTGAVQDFNSQLGLGDALLISLLNHSDINTALMTSSNSIGDINREVARRVFEQADGYAEIKTIAEATGLDEQDVRVILERIAAGSITKDTIARGKCGSIYTNRSLYLRQQSQKQEKVYNYLEKEIERMSCDPDCLNVLYQDLGAGYAKNLLSGYDLDEYQVMLDKKYLAKVLDDVVDSKNPYSVTDYNITKTDAYKVSKGTRSILSSVIQYEMGVYKESVSKEQQEYLTEHLKNGILSESEAREYLILSGEYKEGEYGIGEAAKQLSKGYKHLQSFETVLDTAGDAMSTVDKVRKVSEFIEYWATDYAQQELLLDYMVENLTLSGSDMELLVAAKELQAEYEDKLSGIFDKVYSELMKKGVGTVKSIYPPLSFADTCISLAGTLTGADDHVKALETGLAMQDICKQALDDYQKAVVAVDQGDTSAEALSRVLTTFEVARQSLVSYYKAMIQLAGTEEEKSVYSAELKKLEEAKCGYAVVSFPFGSGKMGGR